MGEVKHNKFLSYDHHNYHHPTTTRTMKRLHRQSSSTLEGFQEEAAFANDAIRGARLGGSSMWPQRSYSCSFCKREFRSAQALGGHMNVHRRDRALLKQVITSHHDHNHDHLNHHDHDHDRDRGHKVSSSSKSQLPQNQFQVCGSRTSVAHHNPSYSRVSTNSTLNGVRKVISGANDVVEGQKSMRLDLAMGTYQEVDHHQEEFLKYKRFKKSNDYSHNNNVVLFPCFEEIKSSIKDNNRDYLQGPEKFNLEGSKSMEELDLELRLGEPPQKVK